MTRPRGRGSLSSLAVLVVLGLCACAVPERARGLARRGDGLLGRDASQPAHEDDAADNRVLCGFAGTAARAHTASAASYSHYSLLRTIEEAWGLAPLTGADAAAEPMDDLLVR